MTLYQQGSNVTGEWTQGITGGSFSGSASGGSLNSCTFTESAPSGSASAQGTLTLSGNTLSGTCGVYNVSLTQSQ